MAVATPPSEPPSPQPRTRKRRSGGVVVPHAPRWHQRVMAGLIYALVRLISATVRCRWTDRSEYLQAGCGPAIYCCWHNRLALCTMLYYRYVRKRSRGQGMAALVSASKDGAFLAAILGCFGIHAVRGSSSRRGARALLELTNRAEQGYDVTITPDGPRGPRYLAQEGIIHLAQVTGRPIIPAGYYLHWKIQLRSWDRFQIPLPFTRSDMAFGKAIHVPRDASEADRERLRQQLEQTLKEISQD